MPRKKRVLYAKRSFFSKDRKRIEKYDSVHWEKYLNFQTFSEYTLSDIYKFLSDLIFR